MSVRQFANSIRSILRNPHINRGRGVARHLHWQYRKALNRFPFEQRISESRIIAGHKRCGVSALIYSQGLYDHNNMNLVRLLLRDGGVLFDVGANIGTYTLVASESARARVFAFEPHPRTFDLLKGNVELNRRQNVTLINAALSDESGRVLFTNDPGSAVNHLMPAEAHDAISVACLRADEVCARYGVAPTMAKVDVEGFEYGVLAGFGVCRRSLDVLLVETNGLSDERSTGQETIHRLLSSDGFVGPLWCDFDSKTLRRTRPHSEDSLYLSERFFEAVDTYGFSVEPLR
jgi:FkbM family methyltransferase